MQRLLGLSGGGTEQAHQRDRVQKRVETGAVNGTNRRFSARLPVHPPGDGKAGCAPRAESSPGGRNCTQDKEVCKAPNYVSARPERRANRRTEISSLKPHEGCCLAGQSRVPLRSERATPQAHQPA